MLKSEILYKIESFIDEISRHLNIHDKL
jgi:hypothetical protein